MLYQLSYAAKSGAHSRIRTGDLILTKDTLCLLSYMGLDAGVGFEPTTFGL